MLREELVMGWPARKYILEQQDASKGPSGESVPGGLFVCSRRHEYLFVYQQVLRWGLGASRRKRKVLSPTQEAGRSSRQEL